MIQVTKSFFPPLGDYIEQVSRAFKNEWLTNRGALVLELEDKITKYLSLNDSQILITNNGTVPIQIALKILGNGGEIITTPFSYVATTSSIVWQNCTPVFVDIDPIYFTIDETKIEDAITERTTCILATHVFGNPCNIEKLEFISKKYGLNLIFDAAHCFAVEYKGKSIFEYGDISTCSFHSTKLFHTGEGGAIFTKNHDLGHKAFYSHNFGHNGPLNFHGVGINGKISELQAAMGLSVLPFLPDIINKRMEIVNLYNSLLTKLAISKLVIRPGTTWNYSYYPIVFETENKLLLVQKVLNDIGIYPRRYFYPSLNTLPFVAYQLMEVSESISKRILCLPLYDSLRLEDVNKICQKIIQCHENTCFN
jgi:dTDP-4-amino-4,6-dideoxygalactose transaminase